MDDAVMRERRSRSTEAEAREGARNLLVNAAAVKPGNRVLIVNALRGGVEPAASDLIAEEAERLGAAVDVVWTPNARAVDEISPVVRAAFDLAEVIILNHRIGAMVRFMDLKGGRYVFNYMITREQLAAPSARMPAGYWTTLLKLLQGRLNRATRFHVTCPNGTDYEGPVDTATYGAGEATGQTFSTVSFPAGVYKPFMSLDASGTIAFRWFTVSGLRYFEPTSFSLPSYVVATVEKGAICDLKGEPAAVAGLRAFLDETGRRFGKDPSIVNSWHGGMNAAMVPYGRLADDLDKWMRIGHNNPRVAHFHVEGHELPGEYSALLLDPTVAIDDEVVWDNGRLAFADQAEVRAALAKFGDPRIAAGRAADIGV